MAQWSHAERTLYTKIVYYGPAFGGKTTNLEALHRITDPTQQEQLLSVKTADDRTLFFDLLPFDLGAILGYRVAMKLYTVPGQVRYDATRQVVLGGADAVVFVADSTTGREEQNRWSLQNLQMNMRAKRLDPATVPVLFQFNKQDVEEAAAPDTVGGWLRLKPGAGVPAVAIECRGVLETFIAASSAMLERLVALADERTRREIDSTRLQSQLDRAFAPYLARVAAMQPRAAQPEAEKSREPIILPGGDLLQDSIETSVRLGQQLTQLSGRASRLEREAEALRGLSESLRRVGASFEREAIVEEALATAARVVEAPVVSLIDTAAAADELRTVHVCGAEVDPLLDSSEGRELVARMLATGKACTVEDLQTELGTRAGRGTLARLCGAASVPLGDGEPAALLVYAPRPEGQFDAADVRFLATLAGHLAVGLQKARLHERLGDQCDRLERTVASRTIELRRANEELRSLDRMKDAFVGNLSHEMKTPLTAILSSAVFLRDYKSNSRQRGEMVESIVGAAETLGRRIDHLLRLSALENEDRALQPVQVSADTLAQEALALAGHEGVTVTIADPAPDCAADLPRLARAVANLIENAAKFSEPGGPVDLLLSGDEDGAEYLQIAVLDRGPGVPAEERETIFAPFEQGGDTLTDKPDGIGLGLYEARRIVLQHGGRLDYHPRKGGGSEFRIRLPLRAAVASRLPELTHA